MLECTSSQISKQETRCYHPRLIVNVQEQVRSVTGKALRDESEVVLTPRSYFQNLI